MGQVTMWKCDHCGKVVENPCKERGWIQLSPSNGTHKVSVCRSTGVYNKSSYENDFLQNVSDFCSVVCLVAALDKKARARDDAKAPA